jgi:ElaB/YqjD/DUF883 family membrane-anchored ribosome-binding protein
MERIIDEKTEKDVRERLDRGIKDAKAAFDSTKKTIGEREEQVSDKIREHPIEWVAGAFVAGMVIAKLLSRRD